MPQDVGLLAEWAWKIGPYLVTFVGAWAIIKHKVAEHDKQIAGLASKADLAQVDRKAQVAHARLDKHEDAQQVAEIVLARQLGKTDQRLDGIDKDLGRIEAGSRY